MEILTKDYRAHLSARLAVAAAQKTKEKTYWLNKLAGKPGKTTFPYDHKKNGPGGEQREQAFAEEKFKLPGEVFSRLIEMSSGSDRRMHMILAAALYTLLMRYTQNHDIIIGTTIVKTVEDTKLINTILALRNQVEERMTFKEIILRVKQSVLEAEENRNYPFEILLEQLDLPGMEKESPLFGTGVVVESIHERRYFKAIKPDMTISFSGAAGNGEGTCRYQSQFYKKTTIRRIIAHYTTLLSVALLNVESKLQAIDMLTPQEKRQILFEFNDTRGDINRGKCYHQVFEEQAAINPGKKAAVHNHEQITYHALNEEANPIAYFLREKGVEANSIVAIYMKRGLEMLASIIGIFKAGGAYLAIDVEYPAERIINILQDSEVKILITTGESYGLIRGLKEKQRLSHLQTILCLDRRKPFTRTPPLQEYPQTNPALYFSTGNIAYVIYTSGTTGKPKGAMIHQLGMLNHIYANTGFLAVTEKDIIAQTASPGFDISVWQFLTAITQGGITYIIDKEIITEPLRLVGELGRGKITILEIVPSLMSVLLEMIEQYDRRQLNYLRWLIPTGEALSASLAREWYSHYPRLKLVNAYGPAEASDDVTLWEVDGTLLENIDTIPIGKPLPNLHVYIMESNMQLCPVHVVGEICIAGLGVGKGYLNDPGKTAASFVPNPYREEIGNNDYSILYRTGDMGYFTGDGNIEFVGRQDHQVKIRGFRIELEEIENRLRNIEEVKEAVVIAKESQTGDKYLCGYVVPFTTGELSASYLRECLAVYLPGYMVPSYFVLLDKIPLTANGKIDRKRLPEPGLKPGDEFIAPGNELEKKLVDIWSKILNLEKKAVGTNANFFELGGHSLNATIMIAMLHKELHVKVPLVEIFKNSTIKQLAAYINGLAESKYAAIEPVEKKEYYQLSSAQKRMYILQQMEPASTVYNTPQIVPMEKGLDEERFREIVKKLIHRHESFRTSFDMVANEPVQIVHPGVQFVVDRYDRKPGTGKTGNEIETIVKNFVKPFNLNKVPLLRVGLIKIGDNRHILLMDVHHIITDGLSGAILVNDFYSLYEGNELPGLRIQYKDYTGWQNRELESGIIKQQEEFWLRQFSGEIPVLNLPIDYPRPGVQNFAGDMIYLELDKTLANKITEVVKEKELTLNILLLTVYSILLAKYSNQEDIVIGTVVAGRPHADLQHIIGMFANMLPLRIQPGKNKSFDEFLAEVKHHTFTTYENQDYQFDDLVSKLNIQRQPGRHPLVDVVFAFWGRVDNLIGESKDKAGNLDGNLDANLFNISHFDLMLHVVETANSIQMRLEYSTNLFKTSAIEEFAGFYLDILEQVLSNPGMKLEDIRIDLRLAATSSGPLQEDQDDWDQVFV